MITIEEGTIDVRKYIGIFISYWWLIVLMPALGAVLGYYVSRNQDPVYEATGTILVQYRGSSLSLGLSDFGQSEQLASTYQRLITATPFLDQVSLFGASVSASTESSPPAIRVSVRHPERFVAASTAQTVAESFIDYAVERRLTEIARMQSAAAAQGITNVQDVVAAQFAAVDSLSLLEPVTTPTRPVVPRTARNIQIGVLLGVVLAGFLSLVLESLRDTVRFPDQLDRRFGATGLGTIFKWSSNEAADDELILLSAPTSGFAESIRQLRANFQFAVASHGGNVVLITSPGPGEGKSTMISNLAVAMAQTGMRVILVDGDLRRPSLHKVMNIPRRGPGVSNVLSDPNITLSDAICKTNVEGVDVLPAGSGPPNPAELLGSPKMVESLSQLRADYDFVFVDSPPLLVVSDGSVLASQADMAVVVVEGNRTRSSDLRSTLDILGVTQVHVAGVIVNKFTRSRLGYGYSYPYYYYYSNYRYYAEGEDTPVNGAGRFYHGVGKRALGAWSRLRSK